MKMFIAFIFAIMQIFPAYAGVKTIVKSDIMEGVENTPELLGNKGHFERNVLGWAAYDDAAGTPVDGTGGSSTTTCTRSTSSPIDGDGSLLMTKGAANYQGEGCALTFTIPANMSGDVLVGTFEYAVASGTFATDDVSVWAYNSTGASMGATSPSGLTNHALVRKTFKFQFTPAYSASAQTFRLLLHIATTSASAYTLKFDNFQIHRKGKAAGLDTQVQYNASGLLTGSSNLVWDYTNNRLGIGITPTSKLHIYDASNWASFFAGDAAVEQYYTRHSDDASSSDMFFRKTRGSNASKTTVATGDRLGRILFQAYGGTNYRNIALISSHVDTYTSDTDISSNLRFHTTPTGTTTASERMRIDSSGNVGIGLTPLSTTSVSKLWTNGDISMSSASRALNFNLYYDSGWKYVGTGYGTSFRDSAGSLIIGNTTTSGTAGAAATVVDRMTIDTSGRVGIGTASPSYPLHVVSTSSSEINVNSSTAATSAAIEIGRGGSGNRSSYIDLTGDDTYTDYGLRIIRNNGGANTSSEITHRGTGILALSATEAGSIELKTSNTTRLAVQNTGDVKFTALSASTVPTNSTSQMGYYQTGSKFVIWYNDAGTMRYKYLDMSGTGVTWVHTTTAP